MRLLLVLMAVVGFLNDFGTPVRLDARSRFDSMTARFGSATTIRATISISVICNGDSTPIEHLLLRERGNRFNLETRFTQNAQEAPCTLISDGARMILGGGERSEEKTPANLDTWILRGLSWSGTLTLMSDHSSWDEQIIARDLARATLSEFQKQGRETVDGRDAVRLSYVIREKGRADPEAARVVLWIDARTQLPLRRRTFWEGGKELELLEVFRDIRLNEPIDPSRFAP